MGRMTKEEFERARYVLEGYLGKKLVAHAEAIELELKVSKEDEQEAVRKYGEAELNIDRLIDNCAQLKRENQRLMNEVDETRAAWLELEKQVPKKVALPKEVADALETFKLTEKGESNDYLCWLIPRFSFRTNVTKSQSILDEYASKVSFLDLVDAIRYGYTVEKTKEDRLREGIKGIYDNFDISEEEIINQLTAFVTKFNAEN